MIRILHTADLHLGATFAELKDAAAAARRADQLETFDRIVSLALERDVHMLLLTGDLFASSWPAANVVAAVQAGFRRLTRGGVLPVVLPGDSDANRLTDGIYRRPLFEGVLVLDPFQSACTPVEIAGRTLHLHVGAIDEGRIVWAEDAGADGVRVGLLYLPEKLARQVRSADAAEIPLLEGWQGDYLAVGGLHDYREWHVDGRLAGCCPGTPEGLDFDETGPRYCVSVEIEAGKIAFEKLAVNGRTVENRSIDLTDCRTHEMAAERIRAQGEPDLLLRLALTGRPDLLSDAARLQQMTEDKFRYLEIEDRTVLLGSRLAKELAAGDTLYGVLVRKAQALTTRLPAEERPQVEAALREILLRCPSLYGELS